MSTRPAPRLPDDAERLLSDWPVPERDDAFWEQLAQGADARLSLTPQGSTPDLLLAAPLPATAEELAAQKAPLPRADVTPLGGAVGSLTELARARVAEREKEAKKLADESLALASQVRRERPRAVPNPAPVARAVQPATSAPPPPAAPSAAPASARGDHRLPWIGGALAVLAAAAAVAIVMMRPAAKPEPAVAQGAEAAAPVKPAPAVVAAPSPSPAQPEPSPGISPEQLPTAEQLAARSPEPGRLAPPAPKKLREAIAAAPPAAAQPAAPQSAPATDELPPNPKLKLADDEERPTRPSTGAVISAVGAVMGGARACVSGHDAPSKASLVFGSDGRVQSVEVTGPAAGTPAEGCIKAALSGARVQPFAEDSFSISVPVRP